MICNAQRCVTITAFVTSVCGCYAPARMADWERLSGDLHVAQRQADRVDLSALAGGSYVSVPYGAYDLSAACPAQDVISSNPRTSPVRCVRPGRFCWHSDWLIGLGRQEWAKPTIFLSILLLPHWCITYPSSPLSVDS